MQPAEGRWPAACCQLIFFFCLPLHSSLLCLVAHVCLIVSFQFTAAGVVQVNVSAQLVPARVKSTDGHKSASGSRRPSLEVPSGDAAALNMNGLPSSTATTPSIGTEWEIKVEVVDQGIGISDAEIGNLFQSFRQAKKVQMAFGGTGLGLAISRSVKHDTCLLDATSAGVLTRCRQRSQHK